MGPIRADLTKSNFALVPADTYIATIASFKRGKPSNGPATKGADTFSVRLTLEGGGSVFDNFINSPTTLWRFQSLAVAAGIDKDEIAGPAKVYGFMEQFEDFDFEEGDEPVYFDELFEQLVGAEVEVDIGKQPATDQYKEKNTVEKYKPAPGNYYG